MQQNVLNLLALRAIAVVLACGPLAAATSYAQAWPNKPVRLVVVFPPGGSVDQVARILQPALSQQLGQTVIVENRGGASGAIGTQAVAKAEPDGYTFGMVFDTHAANPALIPSMGFDTQKDLAEVTLIGTSAMALVASSRSEYNSFKEVLDATRANKAVNYGSIGAGSLGHLALALLGKNYNLAWQHIPYKGGGPLITDVVGGHVPLAVGSVFLMKPHIAAKTVRPLAVTTAKRSPDLPDVPTIAESGFPGFEAPAWWGMVAPAGTPPEIIARMNAEMIKALKRPDIAKKLDEQGIDVIGSTPEAFRVFVGKQIDIWGKVIRDNKITVN
jgi:tripartite-type tricarboxylate transporter receptor subunit TctC